MPYVERDGQRFVARPDGSDIFGEITPEIGTAIGREAGPIRLPEGNKTFGEYHIEIRRASEIQAAGYSGAASFVEAVVTDFDAVYQGDRGRLLLAEGNRTAKVVVIELRPIEGGSHWSVTTAGLQRAEYLARRELLWRRPGPGGSPP